MPQIMQPNNGQSGGSAVPIKTLCEAVGVQRLAVLSAKYQVRLVVERAEE